jgi:outer membrane receptor protein involved in Fe transport
VSGGVGGEVQLTDRLRLDLGARVEYNTLVQHSENTSRVDLDGDPATLFDGETFGNNSFTHFSRSFTGWSAWAGLNFRVTNNASVYGSGSRGYKMPALDEFLNTSAQEQIDLFDSREVLGGELGFKYTDGRVGVTLNGFYTTLRNIIGQEARVDTVTGGHDLADQDRSGDSPFGAEVEALVTPVEGLQLLGSGTIFEAELGPGIDSLVGVRLGGVPTTIGNLVALYSPRKAAGLQLKGDWHWVGSRFTDSPQERFVDARLPSYDYFNFGVALALPNAGARINLDLLNAFQSKGLEEGNPRLVSAGTNIFLARPLLPRRLQASIEYDFGGGGSRR